jgi:hypothetical protein
MEIHMPHFSIEDMPRLAETAIEVSALTTVNSPENKQHIYDVIYKPVCFKILAAQGEGPNMGRWGHSIPHPIFFGHILAKFKETILRVIRHWEKFYSCLSRCDDDSTDGTDVGVDVDERAKDNAEAEDLGDEAEVEDSVAATPKYLYTEDKPKYLYKHGDRVLFRRNQNPTDIVKGNVMEIGDTDYSMLVITADKQRYTIQDRYDPKNGIKIWRDNRYGKRKCLNTRVDDNGGVNPCRPNLSCRP